MDTIVEFHGYTTEGSKRDENALVYPEVEIATVMRKLEDIKRRDPGDEAKYRRLFVRTSIND